MLEPRLSLGSLAFAANGVILLSMNFFDWLFGWLELELEPEPEPIQSTVVILD